MHDLERMKDRLVEEAKSRFDNLDGGSIQEMGLIVDMIKDLAVAEKSCAEAEYYECVVDAMDDRDGYTREGYMRDGYRETYYPDREGYRNSKGQYAKQPSRRRMRRSGYSEESVDNLRQVMEEADPERRKQLKKDLMELMQEL